MRGFKVTNAEFAAIADAIRPQDIVARVAGGFGKAEVESTADNLVRFFRERGSWGEFAVVELEDFSARTGWKDLFETGLFFGLSDDWSDFAGDYHGDFVRLRANGRLMVTDEFILRCAGRHEDVKRIRGGPSRGVAS
ncbi:MAG: hypothetical protein KGI78_01255 [Patescibacteria group bacterium]|nr:hypothetical protein [Patescibacteria group bacterium]MDE1944408.1 hypothetical protein [Patescibacteria group bacterium]MDE1945393.1 hypothetical protein [Patescibacteria group bacterium]MDE2057461.1 hypothetical protein [Patescibacteria group bacterium]